MAGGDSLSALFETSQSMSTTIGKVPGQLPKPKSAECIENVGSLSMPVLLEILERQKKLLANRSFVSKLPDKGSRIIKLKERLEEELKSRQSTVDICEVMSGLKIDGKGISDSLEWEGKCVPGQINSSPKETNCNDDENDVLKILVTHSSATNNKKEIRIEKQEESLVKPSDLVDSEGAATDDLYVLNLCMKLENVRASEKFLPHKTLKHKPKERAHKERDLSAITPPPMKHPPVKTISLQQSISLQLEQARLLKEVQIKHAAERLKDRTCLIGDKLPPPETTAMYRESPASDSEEEIRDECEPEDTGGVVFTITD